MIGVLVYFLNIINDFLYFLYFYSQALTLHNIRQSKVNYCWCFSFCPIYISIFLRMLLLLAARLCQGSHSISCLSLGLCISLLLLPLSAMLNLFLILKINISIASHIFYPASISQYTYQKRMKIIFHPLKNTYHEFSSNLLSTAHFLVASLAP